MQQERYDFTMRKVVKLHAPRVSVLRMQSTDAAAHFANRSLAFVYLDANHVAPPQISNPCRPKPNVRSAVVSHPIPAWASGL